MLLSPIGWRLCNNAGSLTTYTAGTELPAGQRYRGEDYAGNGSRREYDLNSANVTHALPDARIILAS
jgi:hypothetical protein